MCLLKMVIICLCVWDVKFKKFMLLCVSIETLLSALLSALRAWLSFSKVIYCC